MKISVKEIALMAVLTAVSLTIFVIEAQFPLSVMAGIKLGLSNIVTLIAMLFIGRRDAGIILAMRIVLATAFYGTFVSFVFSVTGGVFAFAVMALTVNRLDKHKIWVVSVLGGIFHNIGQLTAACFIIGQSAVFGIAPYLIISGIVTGFFTGICTQRLWFSPLRNAAEKFVKKV